MSGVIERIEALLERIAVAVEGAGAAASGGAASGGKPATAPAGGKVTHEQLTALVQPLVQKEEDKAKVKAILTKFGLKRLGDAKPDQIEALYAEFSAVANAEPADEDLIG